MLGRGGNGVGVGVGIDIFEPESVSESESLEIRPLRSPDSDYCISGLLAYKERWVVSAVFGGRRAGLTEFGDRAESVGR